MKDLKLYIQESILDQENDLDNKNIKINIKIDFDKIYVLNYLYYPYAISQYKKSNFFKVIKPKLDKFIGMDLDIDMVDKDDTNVFHPELEFAKWVLYDSLRLTQNNKIYTLGLEDYFKDNFAEWIKIFDKHNKIPAYKNYNKKWLPIYDEILKFSLDEIEKYYNL